MPQIRDNNRHATCRQMICRALDTAPMGPAWLYETRKKLARAYGKFGATHPSDCFKAALAAMRNESKLSASFN